MSFKIQEITDAGNIPQPQGTKATPVLSPRDRAIQRLMESTAQGEQKVQQNQEVAQKTPAVEGQKYDNEASSAEPTEAKGAEEQEKAPEEPLSSQYAILARKEKAIRQREQQLRAKELAIKAAEESKAAPSTQNTPAFDPNKYVDRERLAKDPFTVLTEMGLSYDQLTEMALNAPNPESIALQTKIKQLEEKLESVLGETEKIKLTTKEQEKMQYDLAVKQIRREAEVLVKNNEAYETVRETNSIDDVVDLIERTYEEDGVLMTVEEAVQAVEEELFEEAMKLSRLKKIQQKTQQASKPVETQQKQTSQSEQSQMKTLTNQVSSSRKLTARERAILAFEGKLQK